MLWSSIKPCFPAVNTLNLRCWGSPPVLKMLREKGWVLLEGMYSIKTLKLILFSTSPSKCSCTMAPPSPSSKTKNLNPAMRCFRSWKCICPRCYRRVYSLILVTLWAKSLRLTRCRLIPTLQQFLKQQIIWNGRQYQKTSKFHPTAFRRLWFRSCHNVTPTVPGLMLLQNHLHTWDLKCVVLIKALVCHAKPLFIAHCHLSAMLCDHRVLFDHETLENSHPSWKKLTFDWASVGLDVASKACELIVTKELLGRPAYGDERVDSASTTVDVESWNSHKNARNVDIIIPNIVPKCRRTCIGTKIDPYLVPT